MMANIGEVCQYRVTPNNNASTSRDRNCFVRMFNENRVDVTKANGYCPRWRMS